MGMRARFSDDWIVRYGFDVDVLYRVVPGLDKEDAYDEVTYCASSVRYGRYIILP